MKDTFSYVVNSLSHLIQYSDFYLFPLCIAVFVFFVRLIREMRSL